MFVMFQLICGGSSYVYFVLRPDLLMVDLVCLKSNLCLAMWFHFSFNLASSYSNFFFGFFCLCHVSCFFYLVPDTFLCFYVFVFVVIWFSFLFYILYFPLKSVMTKCKSFPQWISIKMNEYLNHSSEKDMIYFNFNVNW